MSRSNLTPFIGLGQVVKHRMYGDLKVVKVRLQKMSLDKNLLMYFPKKTDKWSADFKKECKLGDIVVIKNLDEKIGYDVSCKVEYVMYSTGAVRDPVTGKLCRGTDFIDEEDRSASQKAMKEGEPLGTSV